MRKKSDLIYRHKITLQDAIKCQPVKIPLLDGRSVLLAIDQVITPKTVKMIEGEGMPIYDKEDHMGDNVSKGNLYVCFEIVFPKKLNNQQKQKI